MFRLTLVLALLARSGFGQVPKFIEPKPKEFPNYSGFPSTSGRTPAPALNYYSSDANRDVINRQIVEQDLLRRKQEAILEDSYRELNTHEINYSFKSNLGRPGASYYKSAFDTLSQMLLGKIPLSYKKSVFLTEWAFYEGTLSFKGFDKAVKSSAAIIKQKLKQDKLPNTDLAKNWEIFQFFSDTIRVTMGPENKKITHYPIRYDFDDFYGERDWTKGMVSKLLQYQSGQCHSMPLLFLILSEELGSKAYLAYSPEHSYIKIPLSNGRFQNLELTNGRMTTDSYILGSGFIKAEAIVNRIYMEPLAKRDVIAGSVLDLAKGYRNKYGLDEFYLKMVNTALAYKQNDVLGIYQKASYYYWLYQYVLDQDSDPAKKKAKNSLEIKDIVNNLKESDQRLRDLGYSEMPRDAYAAWLKSIEKERENSKKLENTVRENLWSTKK